MQAPPGYEFRQDQETFRWSAVSLSPPHIRPLNTLKPHLADNLAKEVAILQKKQNDQQFGLKHIRVSKATYVDCALTTFTSWFLYTHGKHVWAYICLL